MVGATSTGGIDTAGGVYTGTSTLVEELVDDVLVVEGVVGTGSGATYGSDVGTMACTFGLGLWWCL